MKPLDNSIPGPLKCYGTDFAAFLTVRGYAATSIRLRLYLLRHFSSWLDTHNISLKDCDDKVLASYQTDRARTHQDMSSPGKIAPMIEFLRLHGLIPDAPMITCPPPDPCDELLNQWCHHLLHTRSVQQTTTDYYCYYATPFARQYMPDGAASVLVPESIRAYIAEAFPHVTKCRAVLTVTALRSFLQFLYSSGRMPEPLDHLVLRPRVYRDSTIPKGLSADDTNTLIAAVSTDTSKGKRNRAIMLLLARLGLRASEVAALTLDDIDWRNGTIRIHGKGGYTDRMPLPTEVGAAISAYLLAPKPPTDTGRAMFLSAKAPYRPITRNVVKCIVADTARAAGIDPVSAHRFRHALATTTINAGASLEEVGQLLRHRHLSSTTIYAKVDLTRLRLITRPWPSQESS